MILKGNMIDSTNDFSGGMSKNTACITKVSSRAEIIYEIMLSGKPSNIVP
jgi:hypothetical protein